MRIAGEIALEMPRYNASRIDWSQHVENPPSASGPKAEVLTSCLKRQSALRKNESFRKAL
jgi:hypothetical protein